MLLILLEQDLIFQHDIENKVCPILLALSAPDSDDDCKAEAVSVSLRGRPHRRLLPRNWACARLDRSPVVGVGSVVLKSKAAGDSASGTVQSSDPSMFESDYLYLTNCFKKAKLGKAVIWAELRQLQDAEICRCALEPVWTMDLVRS